jgi:hypothetical protein
MNELSSTEILTLENGISYAPVWIVTDKRISDPEKTTLKYPQVGGPTTADKIGNANGPIYMIEFADLDSVVTATHIKILGLDNDDLNAALYPVAYLKLNPKVYVWLDQFEFTNSAGTPVAAGGAYTIFGHRKRKYPVQF